MVIATMEIVEAKCLRPLLVRLSWRPWLLLLLGLLVHELTVEQLVCIC